MRVETAREEVAQLLVCLPEQVIFTSGGTEANNTVLSSLGDGERPKRLVTTSVEHPSVIKASDSLRRRGVEVIQLDVTADGLIRLVDLESALASPTDLVSVQWVNNETGVIQPIAQIAEICRRRAVLFHTDAAQAVGKLPVSFIDCPVDFLTLTAHKFRGPQGAGAIVARDPRLLRPLMAGGDQESGKRPGTENVPAIAGLGAAARLRRLELGPTLIALSRARDTFERLMLEHVEEVRINGSSAERVGNTTNLQFSRVDGEALVAHLDAVGIRCSQTSACHNQRPEPSHVLRAMGLTEEEAYSSVRFSFGEPIAEADLRFCVKACADFCYDYRHTLRQRAETY